jgi:poly(3-hydroxyoctanoate) depolymerase
MDREFLSWRGHRVHVTAIGEGAPILLLTGVGANTEMWAPFTAQLTTRRIISFDVPGNGRSSTSPYPLSIPSLASLAVAVMDRFRVPRADVVGYSYGGVIAQQLAHDHPTRVGRLVLAATHCGIGCIYGSLEAVMAISTPLRFYSVSYFDRTAAACFGGASGRNAAVRRKMIAARRMLPPSTYGYAMQLLGIVGWTSRPFLSSIAHDTLVISGDEDPLVPMANSELLASCMPNATLEIVKGAGHLLLLDDAEHVGGRIDRFVNAAPLTVSECCATAAPTQRAV